mmetsp:Transcript_26336/g.39817  ORF Transcript_26336/g.39817 Transcript_26336/m.39817 type:complete len:82 (-) Transcript_26336:95-340(-)
MCEQFDQIFMLPIREEEDTLLSFEPSRYNTMPPPEARTSLCFFCKTHHPSFTVRWSTYFHKTSLLFYDTNGSFDKTAATSH